MFYQCWLLVCKNLILYPENMEANTAMATVVDIFVTEYKGINYCKKVSIIIDFKTLIIRCLNVILWVLQLCFEKVFCINSTEFAYKNIYN